MSLRRVAREMKLSRTTVARKLQFLGQWASDLLAKMNSDRALCEVMEFDDLETFEHTKCKPLSVTLAVENGSRWILGFEVSRKPAKGPLAVVARKKDAPLTDERMKGRRLLFLRLQYLVKAVVQIKSDQNPHYAPDVRKHFPKGRYQQFKGQRGSIVGQGELKKVRFDPLFSLNHTCAMLRANINRLFRRTWCTTKLPENLAAHIAMYTVYHNLILLERLRPAG